MEQCCTWVGNCGRGVHSETKTPDMLWAMTWQRASAQLQHAVNAEFALLQHSVLLSRVKSASKVLGPLFLGKSCSNSGEGAYASM